MGCRARMLGCACVPKVKRLQRGKMRLGRDLNLAWLVESALWPVTYGGVAGLGGVEVRVSSNGP